MARNKDSKTFIFDSYSLNPITKRFKFHYRLILGEEELDFTEELVFPERLPWQDVDQNALNNILQALHIVMGTSYWKLHCPENLLMSEYSLTKAQADFWKTVYTEGMGEFYYRNKLDFTKFPGFSYHKESSAGVSEVSTQNKSLLFFGGGKDSWTSYELLKKAKKDVTFFSVVAGNSETLKKMLPKDAVIVERYVDPALIEISQEQGVYRGHVPISMIWAFIGELAAILYGYRYVIASNEKSADYGNVKYRGKEVNHQWSKSFTAERALQEYSKNFITPSVTYFSLLRPLYEYKIVEIFSKLGRRHFESFTSCNRNFRMTERGAKSKWCLECPKCLFVFTLLAVFLDKKSVIRIFGDNLFGRKELIPLLKELLGLRKFKPFECVGLPEEMILAMKRAEESGDYSRDVAIKMFSKEFKSKKVDYKRLERRFLDVSKEHLIPREFIKVLSK